MVVIRGVTRGPQLLGGLGPKPKNRGPVLPVFIENVKYKIENKVLQFCMNWV